MHLLHWQKASRYYQAEIRRDLFSAEVLVVSWGGVGRRPLRVVSRPCGSRDEAETALRAVARRRVSRGYSLTFEVRP